MTSEAACPAVNGLVRVFFAEAGAVVLPLDEPAVCAAFPGLLLRGVALAGGRRFLVVVVERPGLPAVVAHLGPDEGMVARRGLLLVAGLRAHGDLGLVDGAAVLSWLADCWVAMTEEISVVGGELEQGPAGRPREPA